MRITEATDIKTIPASSIDFYDFYEFNFYSSAGGRMLLPPGQSWQNCIH